jgi:short-subunit dehydrogenase
MKLEGAHVAVTGASSGIGEALARELGRAGAKVTVVARRREKLEALAAELGARCRVVAHDLGVPARAAEWVDEAEQAFGPIDVLCNNAGIENTGPTARSDLAGGIQVLHTNLHSPLTLCMRVLPPMLARNSGTIVNVASIAGLTAPPMQAWYGASKAGLAQFSEALRGELRRTRVKVLTVYPGPVKTAMSDAAYEAFGGRKGAVGLLPEGQPDKLARLIRRAIERGRARLIYPRFYHVTRLFPWLARWLADAGAPRVV